MSAVINSTYPSFNNVSNYSGVHTTVKSAGRVNNAEQNQAIIALEREGKINLSQFGLIKLPREVLFAQDVQGSKIKATRQGDQVQSSSKTDLEEEHVLSKVENNNANSQIVDPIKDRKEKQGDAKDKKDDPFASLITPMHDAAPTESTDSSKPADDVSAETVKTVLGAPSDVYQTLQTSSLPASNGQQLSVLA